jgi:DNA relaxase NicK
MCGQRLDSCILRLEGIAAHAWLAAGFPAGHNISRIDIAATVWGVSEQSAALARHKEEADEYRKALQHRPYKVRLIDGVGDGDTLYCGTRESKYFLRVYDKERAPNTAPEYKGALRYEAECKEELARQVYEGAISGGYSVANCCAVLGALLTRRGISPLSIGCLQSAYLPHIAVPRTDVERSIAWLRTQVKPTLQNLLRMGYEQEALEALGLNKFWRDYAGSD